MRLRGKTFVIIGGTSGLGLSAAKAFVREGAQVVVMGRDAAKVQQAGNELGAAARALAGDATRPDAAEKAIQLALEAFHGCDGLYHVAGGSGRRLGDGPLEEITDRGWTETLSLNLDSVFYSNRAALRHFRSHRGGTILNMTSVLGWAPSPQYFATHAYATAKAAIIGMTRAAASYYADHNIRINALAPALVATPMSERAQSDAPIMEFIKTKQPLEDGRIGKPEDLDGAAVYFMSDDSRYVTGQVLAVDGGWSVSEGQIINPQSRNPEDPTP